MKNQTALSFDFDRDPFIALPPWRGFAEGPSFETLIHLQDKALAGEPFTALEEFLWHEYQFAPPGYRYDTRANLIKLYSF